MWEPAVSLNVAGLVHPDRTFLKGEGGSKESAQLSPRDKEGARHGLALRHFLY